MEFQYFVDETRLEEYLKIPISEFELLAQLAKEDSNYLLEFPRQIDILTHELELDTTPTSLGFINYLTRSLESKELAKDLISELLKISPKIILWKYLIFECLSFERRKEILFEIRIPKVIPYPLLGTPSQMEYSIYLEIISKCAIDEAVLLTTPILKNKILKTEWFQVIRNLIDELKKTKSTESNFTDLDDKDLQIQKIILGVLFHYWIGGLNKFSISALTLNYLDWNPISIYQYEIQETEGEKPKYILMVHLFYLIYAFLDVHYISLIEKIPFLDLVINDLRRGIEESATAHEKTFLETRIKYYQKLQEYYRTILKKNSINVDTYFITLFDWLTNSLGNQEIPDSLFNQIIQTYLTFYAKSETLKLGASLPNTSLSMLINLFNEQKFSRPSQIEIFQLMQRTFLNHNFGFLDDYYFRAATFPALVQLYIDLENDNYNKYPIRFQIQGFIRGISLISKSCFQIWLSLFTQKDPECNLLKLLNIIFSDLSTFLEKALEEIEKLHKFEKNPALEELKDFDPRKAKENIIMFLDCVDSTFEFLDKIGSNARTYYLKPELAFQIARSFDFYLTKLLGGRRSQLKLTNPREVNFDPVKILEQFGKILIHILGYDIPDIFIENLCQDPASFDIKIYHSFYQVLKKKGRLGSLLEMTLESLIKKLKEYVDLYGELEWPDEFCDPFFCDPIQKPICVPSSGIIMNDNNLRRMILEDGKDPYRQDLTIEELEEFNQTADIQQKLKDFEERKNKWLRSNIKKEN